MAKTKYRKPKKVILQFDTNKELLEVFNAVGDASDMTGVNVGLISQCCRKMIKTAGGFIWEYGDTQIYNALTHKTHDSVS